MPLLKRIFGQGKSKASNTLVALCIGDYSRLTLNIEHEVHPLEALLAHDTAADDGSPSPRQPLPEPSSSKGSLAGVPQQSFRAFRYVLQHFGGASSSSSHDGADAQSERQLTQFLKQLGGCSSVSFVAPTEDGLVLREKVLSKLTKLFKHSTAPVVIVSYCGPSDERGNWRLSSQVGGGSSVSSPTGSTASERGGGGGGSAVVSFREVSMLWQRYRKHSQRLVLVLDCANSGYWVSALRMLSKAEQLELSLGVQASDSSSPSLQHLQLTYQPGIFTQLFLSNNKWRRDPRRTPNQQTQSGSASGQQSQPAHPSASPPLESLDPQEPQEPQDFQSHQSPQDPQNAQQKPQKPPPQQQQQPAPVPVPRIPEQWLPGMLPSYYATWLNDNLVDYGVALRFFNVQTVNPSSMLHSEVESETVITDSGTGSAAARSCGGNSAGGGSQLLSAAPQLLSPGSRFQAANRGWRSSTALLATVESVGSLCRASRLGDEAVTPPGGSMWASTRSVVDTPAERSQPDVEAAEEAAERRAARAAAAASRAASLPDNARRRWSSLADYYGPATGEAASEVSPAGVIVSQTLVFGSPTNPLLNRVRMSTPQAEWRQATMSPSGAYVHRSPTLPGEDTLYKMYHDAEGSASVDQISHSATDYASLVSGPTQHGVSGGDRLASTCPTDDGADARSKPMPRPASPPPPPSLLVSTSVYKSSPSSSSAPPPPPLQPSASAPAAVPVATAEGPRSPAGFGAAALQLHDAGMDDDSTSGAVAAGFGAGAGDDDLAVLPSARSDTAAVNWDRRSIHAERCLLEEERGNGVASSFTGPTSSQLQGFACELFGALHMVATERRLMARRAPLEGDESLDTMMRDADTLEREASVASLPSAMLPRFGGAGSGAGGGVGGGDGTNSTATASQRTPLLNSLTASVHGVTRAHVSTAQLLTPRSSGAGFVTVGGEVATPAPAGAGSGAGEVPPSSSAAPRQLSRLFFMSMGDVNSAVSSEGVLGLVAMPPIAQGSGEHGEDDEEEAEEEGLSLKACVEQTAMAQRQQQGQGQEQGQYPGRDEGLGQGRNVEVEVQGRGREGASGLVDVAVSLLSAPVAEEMKMRGLVAAEGEAVGAGQVATAMSLDWLQPSHSPAPSPVASMVAGDRRVRASGAGGHGSPSHMLRNLLRGQVSIADSMDLDTASGSFAGPSAATRRPGRFEMAGSESSSFVFGDDRERFEMLKLLRQHQAEAEEAEALAGAEAAGAPEDADYVVVDYERYGRLRNAEGEDCGVAQAVGALLVSTERSVMEAASAGAGGMKGAPGDGATFLLSMETDGMYGRDPHRFVSRQRSGRECECEIEEAFGRGKSVREAWGPESEGRR